MPDDNRSDQQNLITSLRRTRERLLKDLDERNGDLRETFKKLDKVEDLLAEYDPGFVAPPRRLSNLKPVDAAIVLLLESGRSYIPENELIDLLLAEGVCFGNWQPKRDIRRAFSSKSQKMLEVNKETVKKEVSLSKHFYEVRARDVKRARKWIVDSK